MEESNPELESFRQQWKAEVTARTKAGGASNKGPQSSTAEASKTIRRPPAAPRIPTEKATENENITEPQAYHDLGGHSGLDGGGGGVESTSGAEPQSALEHYEKAVERENAGVLGDSLDLYRKAFKMDARVDLKYKNKHFPPSYFASKPTNPTPSNASATVPSTAHHSLNAPPQTINELIAGFCGLKIEPAAPDIEGTPAPPCAIAELPDEILVHIFEEVAIRDVASFVRLARVCKSMAYLVATEEQIWKRICQGSEVGFRAMHYQWQREVLGGPLEDFPDVAPQEEEEPSSTPSLPASPGIITLALIQDVYSSSWHRMFRLRPRIRFNGCYISTNNYIRPGQASATQVSWNGPVHIVTYYRYLRFFRDGTVISLLTTDEPVHVIHHLTPALLNLHRANEKSSAHLPSAVMQSALRGRWRLSPVNEHPDVELKDAEGDVCVETEGVGPKYIYSMDFSLRSAGKGAKNNKLAWRGFWSYNKLTDDWAEFTRKNEKPLYWSRVRSYGDGA